MDIVLMRPTIFSLFCMAFTGIGLYVLYFAVAAARSGYGFISYGPLLMLSGVLWWVAIFLAKKAVR